MNFRGVFWSPLQQRHFTPRGSSGRVLCCPRAYFNIMKATLLLGVYNVIKIIITLFILDARLRPLVKHLG